MKSENPNTNSTSEINHRLALTIQTRGGLGKSTEAICKGNWLDQHGVPWKGYDLDVFNHTLSSTFPDAVTLIQASREPEADIIKILRKVTQVPVTLIDPQAHMNKIILSAMAKVDFPKFAAQAQARATVLIFPIDEISDMEDISETVDTLEDSVDWVIVRNPERIPTTKFFDGSQLEKQLETYHAGYLEIPSLLTDTRNHLRGIQVKLGRTISPAEAIANGDLGLDLVHRMVLEGWLGEMFRRFNAIKSYLVPDFYAEKIAAPGDIRKTRERPMAAGINLENIL
ncbi:MAG: hypothetical protein LV481_12285 [Methylacidiphilales bacterium]|nr:hypothetical protein [Candidatus Methylacidiphilales bacterium]